MHARSEPAYCMRRLALALALIALAASPCGARHRLDFYIGCVADRLIFAIAASSLNLILGFGGMVSFGHAAFFGLGAYVGRDRCSAMASPVAWLHLAAAVAGGGARRWCRRNRPAHARRLLHHDHARFRADALLPRRSR